MRTLSVAIQVVAHIFAEAGASDKGVTLEEFLGKILTEDLANSLHIGGYSAPQCCGWVGDAALLATGSRLVVSGQLPNPRLVTFQNQVSYGRI